jgi:N-methylhydantoinase B
MNPGDEGYELPRKAHMHLEVKAGDRIYHVISASGGHGDPWERKPEKVLVDVQDEKLTVPAAREQYGVVIDPLELAIDWEKTAALRRQRQPSSMAAD